MLKSKFLILLFVWPLLTLLFIKCEDSGYVDEGGYEINGIVLDSSSPLPIQDAIVGFTNYPDSIIVTVDSIHIIYPYMLTKTDDLGKFRISQIGGINMQNFEDMFTWEKEFKLWRYKNEPVPINEIKENSFELNIYLSKK